MSSEPRETTNQPNQYGFAGAPTTPEPNPERESRPTGEVDGESIAVPAGDLTGAITEAIEGATRDDEK